MVALKQYASGRVSADLKDRANRLINRLTDQTPGNPGMLYGTCTYINCERNQGPEPHMEGRFGNFANPHHGPWDSMGS